MKHVLVIILLYATSALASVMDRSQLKDFILKDIQCISSASQHQCDETLKVREGLVYKLSVTCYKMLIVQLPDTSKMAMKVEGKGFKSQSVVQNNMGSVAIVSYMNRRNMEKQARAQVDDKLKDARSCR